MIPLLVRPEEERLGHMLDRILAVLEEQDLYALPGDVNRSRSDYFLSLNTTEDEDDEEDEAETSSRRSGGGDTSSSSMNLERYQEQEDEGEMSILDDNGNEVPIIVIRPVARRPRPQRRNYIVGTRRQRKYGIRKGGFEESIDDKDDLIAGYRKIKKSASEKKIRSSRSRSKSPMHHHRHNNSAGGASVQQKRQFPPINN